MSDERRWDDRDRDWRSDRDRYDYGERGRQDERSLGRSSGGERYSVYDQRRYGGRMDYDAGNPARFGREAWGGAQPYAASDWPSSGSDFDYRRDYRGGGSDYGASGRDYGRGYGAWRGERDYAGSRLERGYGSGYGRDERAGWGSSPDHGRRDYGRGEYERAYGGYRSNDDRNWFDKAGDEVQSWFGDRDAEHRRRQDRMREGEHRGRGPSGYRRSDERIREDLNDRLCDDSWLDASNIEVHVREGEVTLNGMVHDRHDKHHAEDLAEHVSGVRHVQNNLRLKVTSGGLAAAGAGTSAGATTTATGQPKTSKETL
ncbi:MAG TPA: BON domain-containing protein [Caulobacteraceae bacterium]|jgi:osmotically-inducible protein OsmY|nr:BON domain-containing protein [Caulobacteraceae bacterium]